MKTLRFSDLRWHGRFFDHAGVRYTNHTCGGFSLVFTGKQLEAELLTNGPSAMPQDQQGFLLLTVDGVETPVALTCEQTHLVLFSATEEKTVTISLLKRTEQQYASFGTVSLTADDAATASPTPEKPHKLLFIGDSYTCGYGNAGQPTDPFDTKQEYGELAYAARTARLLDAEAHYVCRSGVGLYSSCTDDVNKRVTEILIGDLLPYADAVGCDALSIPKVLWAPEAFVPEAVVINLGTNDSGYTQGGEDRREGYAQAVADLLTLLRSQYPAAELVFALGPIIPETGRLFAKVLREVERRRVKNKDNRVSAFLFPTAPESESFGACGHPSMATDESMSKMLSAHLKLRLGW